jgi:Cytochrome P460
MRKQIMVMAILILAMSSGYAMAQGSGSSRTAPPSSSRSTRSNPAVPATPRPPTTAQFAASFWSYLNKPKAPYRQWGTPGKTRRQGGQLKPEEVAGPGGLRRQSDMFHREVGQSFLNGIAINNLQRLPLSSVLVREEYSVDDQTLEYITVMYRAKMANPNHGNWYWMVYKPNGSLARTSSAQGNLEIAGRVQSCIQCHRQAGGNDYVFLNDRPAPGASPTMPPGGGAGR